MFLLLKPPVDSKERVTKRYHITVIDYGNEKITADKFENHDGSLCFIKDGKVVFVSPVICTVISKIETLYP